MKDSYRAKRDLIKKKFDINKNANLTNLLKKDDYSKLYNSLLKNDKLKSTLNLTSNNNIDKNKSNSYKNNYSIKSSANINKNKKIRKIKKKYFICNNNLTKSNIINNSINNSKERIITYNNNYFPINDSISNYDYEKIIKLNHDNTNNNFKIRSPTLENKEINNSKNIKNKKNIFIKNNNNGFDIINNEKIKRNLKTERELHTNYDKKSNKLKSKFLNNINKNISLSNTLSERATLENNNINAKKDKNKINKIQNYRNKNILKKSKGHLQLKSIELDFEKSKDFEKTTNFYNITDSNSKLDIDEDKIILFQNNIIKELNYLINKKKILSLIEKQKQKLIDESYRNYQKYLFLIEKQQQEYNEYEQFLRKNLKMNRNNKKKIEIRKNNLKNRGEKSYFNILKNEKLILNKEKEYLDNSNMLVNNNFLHYNKNALINKSIQKYFILKNDNEKKSSVTNKNKILKTEGNKENINSYENKKFHKNKTSNIKELKLNIKNFQKFRKLHLKIINNNKFHLLKNNYNYTQQNINIKTPNETNNNFNKKKLGFDKRNNDEIKKRLILNSKRINKNLSSERDKKVSSKRIFNDNHKKLCCNLKCQSLNKLNKLDDYIGPNQYGEIIIPNSSKKALRRISEEKERTLNKLKNIFKFQENLRNKEYYSQVKNREIKNHDAYYKNADLDGIILSSEKKSKYHKIKDDLYNYVFKPIKYKVINNEN